MSNQGISILLSHVEVVPEFNPRTYFDEAALKTLGESIKDNGLIQPIVVRPHPSEEGRYQLVAGERRFRASKLVKLDTIDAVVRELDDRQALLVAVEENAKREDISVAEESKVARRTLDLFDGDERESAKWLGWTVEKLRGRLALLHATQKVLDAVASRKIKPGHAELLATLPASTQDGSLDAIINDGVTVADLKARLASFALDLATASFDVAGCQGCPHNSTTQASLFEQSIGEGQCSNHECFTKKTDEHLEAVKAEKATEYPVVFLDREKDPASYTYLLKRGDGAVGPEQIEACRSNCQNCAAKISTKPGEVGKVETDICLDLSCHAKKVKAYAKATAAPKTETTPAGSPAADKGASKPSAPKKKSSAKKTTSASPRKVVSAHASLLREISKDAVDADTGMLEAFALVALQEKHGSQMYHNTNADKDKNARTKAVVKYARMSAEERRAELMKVVGKVLKSNETTEPSMTGKLGDFDHLAGAFIGMAGIELAGRFKLTAEYLDNYTKAGIGSLMGEAGFDKWLDEKEGEGAFKKLLNKKHGEICKAILDSDFDFSQFVPADLAAVPAKYRAKNSEEGKQNA